MRAGPVFEVRRAGQVIATQQVTVEGPVFVTTVRTADMQLSERLFSELLRHGYPGCTITIRPGT